MVYTGTMIEELIEAVEREERRIHLHAENCVELPEASTHVIHTAEQEVWHGAA
jgi:hypothetical protein